MKRDLQTLELLKKLGRMKKSGRKVRKPIHIVAALAEWMNSDVERFFVITLDGDNRIISVTNTSLGTANKTMAHPRDVFRRACLDNALAIIIAHNHPSGKLFRSGEDKNVSTEMKLAGNIMGIQVLDHIIFSCKGYSSEQSNETVYFQSDNAELIVANKSKYPKE